MPERKDLTVYEGPDTEVTKKRPMRPIDFAMTQAGIDYFAGQRFTRNNESFYKELQDKAKALYSKLAQLLTPEVYYQLGLEGIMARDGFEINGLLKPNIDSLQQIFDQKMRDRLRELTYAGINIHLQTEPGNRDVSNPVGTITCKIGQIDLRPDRKGYLRDDIEAINDQDYIILAPDGQFLGSGFGPGFHDDLLQALDWYNRYADVAKIAIQALSEGWIAPIPKTT